MSFRDLCVISVITLSLIVYSVSAYAQTNPPSGGFTKDALMNANYQGWFDFKNGRFEDEEAQITVDIMEIVFGDLNHDGVDDAVIVYNMLSNHEFNGIAVVLNDHGKPKYIDQTGYERSEPVEKVVIKDGIISVYSKTRRPIQPMASDLTVPVVYKYKVVGNKLVELSKKKTVYR
ncbi:MAG TPA: hypothetical protein VEI57_17550 [Nitrospirota bacterium]|nr:hypothetical protein [Nitrospirota bacterium]